MQLLYWETIDEDSDHAKVYRFYLDNIYQKFDLLIDNNNQVFYTNKWLFIVQSYLC